MYSLPSPLRVENTKICASPEKYSQKLLESWHFKQICCAFQRYNSVFSTLLAEKILQGIFFLPPSGVHNFSGFITLEALPKMILPPSLQIFWIVFWKRQELEFLRETGKQLLC